ETGDTLTSILNRLIGPSAHATCRRSIAENIGKIRQHRLDNARIGRRGRGMIEIDKAAGRHSVPNSGIISLMNFYFTGCRARSERRTPPAYGAVLRWKSDDGPNSRNGSILCGDEVLRRAK